MLGLFLILLLFSLVLGTRQTRKARQRAFNMQRVAGDVVAVRTGRFLPRLVRKHILKTGGKAVNKIKGK
tara:strand:+ start:1462 stop:1668 length:207 start_codon:yes stop_codon:yes gene_type:complete